MTNIFDKINPFKIMDQFGAYGCEDDDAPLKTKVVTSVSSKSKFIEKVPDVEVLFELPKSEAPVKRKRLIVNGKLPIPKKSHSELVKDITLAGQELIPWNSRRTDDYLGGSKFICMYPIPLRSPSRKTHSNILTKHIGQSEYVFETIADTRYWFPFGNDLLAICLIEQIARLQGHPVVDLGNVHKFMKAIGHNAVGGSQYEKFIALQNRLKYAQFSRRTVDGSEDIIVRILEANKNSDDVNKVALTDRYFEAMMKDLVVPFDLQFFLPIASVPGVVRLISTVVQKAYRQAISTNQAVWIPTEQLLEEMGSDITLEDVNGEKLISRKTLFKLREWQSIGDAAVFAACGKHLPITIERNNVKIAPRVLVPGSSKSVRYNKRVKELSNKAITKAKVNSIQPPSDELDKRIDQRFSSLSDKEYDDYLCRANAPHVHKATKGTQMASSMIKCLLRDELSRTA